MSGLSRAVVLGVLTGIAGVGAGMLPLGIALEENLDLEILFRLRGTRTPPEEVLVVSIDKASAEYFRLPNDLRKWPRSLHADLTGRMAAGGASVVAFDVFFEEPRAGDQDRKFAEAVRRAGNVVLCERLQSGAVPLSDGKGAPAGGLRIAKIVPPIPRLSQSAAALSPFPLPKIPFKVSKGWTFRTGAGETPTLPIAAFQVFTAPVYDEFRSLLEQAAPGRTGLLPRAREQIPAVRGVEPLLRDIRSIFESDPAVGDRMLEELRKSPSAPPDPAKRRYLASLIRMYQSDEFRYLNFYGPPRTIRTIPYHRFLQSLGESPGPPAIDVKGKAVFVGSSETWQPEQKDGFYTAFSQSDGLDLSGIEIAATAFANLLEDLPVRPLDARARFALLFLWGLGIGTFCRRFSPLAAALGVTGAGILYLVVARQHFAAAGVWYPLAIPLFFQSPVALTATVLWNYVDSNRERRNIRTAFEHYLPNDVVDQLAKNIADLKTSHQLVYGICLATDAEHYTSVSESMDPKDLSSFMNRYYEAVFDPVRQHGGVVSNVIGDSMLAIWVAAEPDPALKDKSCLAALDIASAMRRFDPSADSTRLPTRIGLHAGQILMGNIGAVGHYEYRPVGDIVNTATRVEGLNKHLGTRILVSEEVLRQQDGFLTREVGKFLMAGKQNPVVAHELICRMADSDELQRAACGAFSDALAAFRERRWSDAEEKFLEAESRFGQDGPSRFYLELCARYRTHPPAEPWDGEIRMENK
jgi:adenylate cyclase